MISKPEFWRYLVYNRDNDSPFPIAELYARDDAEAYELWEDYAIDGPLNVDIKYEKEKQIPSVRML